MSYNIFFNKTTCRKWNAKVIPKLKCLKTLSLDINI